MIVSIHQPETFCWLGFFHKLYLSETFVFLDTVQFKKNDFQNRNRIKVGGQSRWLTLPVCAHSLATLIKDMKINWADEHFAKKHLLTIEQNYSHSPYFKDLFPSLKDLYNTKQENLSDFNINFIKLMQEKLGIKTKTVRAGELGLSGKAVGGSEVVLEICKKLNARKYISGRDGPKYLDLDAFKKSGIEVYFQDFKHPEYKQANKSAFVPFLSVMDLYFNHGPNSLQIILENNIRSI